MNHAARPRRQGGTAQELIVQQWITYLAIVAAVVLGSWALLIVLARRLPPGIARDLAAFIPDCVTTVRRLRSDPRVPRRAKAAIPRPNPRPDRFVRLFPVLDITI